MQTVVETSHFAAKAGKRMSRDERDALIDMLAIDPACGTDLGGGLW